MFVLVWVWVWGGVCVGVMVCWRGHKRGGVDVGVINVRDIRNTECESKPTRVEEAKRVLVCMCVRV